VSPVSLAFFTIDHGTATTAVSLVAPLDGRFRLLASGVAPRGTDLEAQLEDLVLRVEAVEPGLLVASDRWAGWARLESATQPARRVLCLAATDDAAADVQRAFAGGGWEVAGRIDARTLDPLAAMGACLDPGLSALALGSPEVDPDRALRARLGPLVAAVMFQRPDLPVLLCGSVADWTGLPLDLVARLPQADHVGEPVESPLRGALNELRLPPPHERWEAAVPVPARVRDLPDGRQTLRQSVATLAVLLDRRIEAVDIGHSGGVRTLAYPTGVIGHLVSADAALVPAEALDEPRQVDEIARWSAIRSDPFSLSDRLRNLRLSPWRDLAGDGGRLRLAALRAALGRLDRQWHDPDAKGTPPMPDMLICAGGAFASVPPPAAAMAVVDGMRRPGAVTLFHDHARLLGPIGALPDDGDRRRLLVDLLDDALLPLGSAIVTGEVRGGSRAPATLRVSSRLQQHDLELAPNALRLVDLPPGVPARVEVEMRDGQVLGVHARRIALDVTGGLGGLLVDTREVPLRLPERSERRRALLETWERPVWGPDR
jgi:hypothetical protein